MRSQRSRKAIYVICLTYSLGLVLYGASKSPGWHGIWINPLEANGTTLMIIGLYFLGLANLILTLRAYIPTGRFGENWVEYDDPDDQDSQLPNRPVGFTANFAQTSEPTLGER